MMFLLLQLITPLICQFLLHPADSLILFPNGCLSCFKLLPLLYNSKLDADSFSLFLKAVFPLLPVHSSDCWMPTVSYIPSKAVFLLPACFYYNYLLLADSSFTVPHRPYRTSF